MLDDGATQQEIADQAGLSQNCISRFLHGTNDISFSRGLKIMRVILAAQTMEQDSSTVRQEADVKAPQSETHR